MRKFSIIALFLLMLGTILPAAAQGSNRLEDLFKQAEMPVTKLEEGRYLAVVTVQDESTKFEVIQNSLSDDPKETRAQFIQLYFRLGVLPQGASLSPALAKQLNVWNSKLSMGKVVVIDNYVWYATTLWLEKLDASTLDIEAVVGHFNAKTLRKELEPYLKQ